MVEFLTAGLLTAYHVSAVRAWDVSPCVSRQGKPQLAEKWYKHALAICIKAHGELSAEAAMLYNILALLRKREVRTRTRGGTAALPPSPSRCGRSDGQRPSNLSSCSRIV